MEDVMGQAANSGRNASLDQKKERSEGRKQNDPARKKIDDRETPPQAKGAFGREDGVAETLDDQRSAS